MDSRFQLGAVDNYANVALFVFYSGYSTVDLAGKEISKVVSSFGLVAFKVVLARNQSKVERRV